MEYWIVYRVADGVELYRGASADAGAAGRQDIPDGADYLIVPAEAVRTSPTDIGAVRQFLSAGIDEAAEHVRLKFITGGSGQALTYLMKQQEAAALEVDAGAPTPMLSAEAQALGMSVIALAVIVRAANAQWTIVGAAIEAARRSAKVAVEAATTLPEIKSAANVDWLAVIAATQN